VSPTKLECIKAIHNNDVRQALGEPTIESMSQIEFLRSSQEFPRLIENLSELEIVKWVVKNWKLEKKDFLLQKKGVMSRKPMDLAKYLQQKFNRFEALGTLSLSLSLSLSLHTHTYTHRFGFECVGKLVW